MRLLKKLFGGKEESQEAADAAEEEAEGAAAPEPAPRNGPRREVIQVVLRETMRRHGIPSDWIECRMLTLADGRGAGLHVLLAIKEGEDRLLTYIHAFQDSFMRELLQFEPKAADWVFSLSWQFEGKAGAPNDARGATFAQKAPEPLVPGLTAGAAAPQAATAPPDSADSELEGDLKALYAALGQRDAMAAVDFEPTRPGLDDEPDTLPGAGVRR